MARKAARNTDHLVDMDYAHSYAGMGAEETAKNVKAGKGLVKVALTIGAAVILLHTLTGCDPTTDNIVRQGVCSVQNTPSLICPNAGK